VRKEEKSNVCQPQRPLAEEHELGNISGIG